MQKNHYRVIIDNPQKITNPNLKDMTYIGIMTSSVLSEKQIIQLAKDYLKSHNENTDEIVLKLDVPASSR